MSNLHLHPPPAEGNRRAKWLRDLLQIVSRKRDPLGLAIHEKGDFPLLAVEEQPDGVAGRKRRAVLPRLTPRAEQRQCQSASSALMYGSLTSLTRLFHTHLRTAESVSGFL